MVIEVPDKAAEGIGLSPELARLEMALGLFRDEKATLEQAARVAGLSVPLFMKELGKRQITLHYDIQDFEKDLKTLRKLRPA
jgi:predicted HTH domain antitoxin